MAGFARKSRTADTLGDLVRARLESCISSGSEHDAVEDDPLSLSHLVHSFLEEDNATNSTDSDDARSNFERVDSPSDTTTVLEDLTLLLTVTAEDDADPFKNLLSVHVSKAMKASSSLKHNKLFFQRNVMAFLRTLGHNAGICKSKWDKIGGLTAGSYEYIDVAASPSSTSQARYFVDVDFVGEFEIARPTDHYARLLSTLPRVFIGRSDELKTIVKLMCASAKRSLKSRELHTPPWRKSRYMKMKWFGPYRRTTNTAHETLPTPSAVKCRFVGFDTGNSSVNGRHVVRTR